MDCKTCRENRAANVPFIVHEAAEARAERHIKRLVISLILAFVMLFASNALWLYCWMQYDYGTEAETETYSVDLDADDSGNANYIGQDGDIYNGTSESNQNEDTDSRNPDSP